MMTKTIVFLFAVLVSFNVNAEQVSKNLSQEVADKLEETKDNTETVLNNDDEDESASIQIVHKDVNNKNEELLENANAHEEARNIQVPKDNNSTKSNAKYDQLLEDLISDSNSDDIVLENNDDKIEEIPTDATSVEENNRQEAIEIIIEKITEAYNHEENKDEYSSTLNEDENNWKSAENIQSDVKEYSNDGANEEVSLEEDDRTYNVEDYTDKKIDLKYRNNVDTIKPERIEHFNTRPINARQYRPEDLSILDYPPRRSFSEIVVPRLRPMLTRNGIMFTPTMYTMQTSSPLLERLAGQHWIPNRHYINPEEEHFTRPPHNRIIGLHHYEDPKMIDDYNDYGTNAYSYAPSPKITTLAPPQQIIAPNKFDIFQKLAEASNQPKKLIQRTFNDNLFPGNFYPQRQFPENYGFDVRRMRRDAWDEAPFQDS